jgi:hypothetical protein
MSNAEAAQLILMYGLIPLWVAAGFADWFCHRTSAIERNSGLRENAFHWVLMAQVGCALLAIALLEVNAAILLLVFAAFLAHEATTYVELRYTVALRAVRPFEQMVHSFMELLPLAALALLAVMEWDQALALFGEGNPDFDLRPKMQPWPTAYLLCGMAAVVLFSLLPLAEETWRCWRTSDEAA